MCKFYNATWLSNLNRISLTIFRQKYSRTLSHSCKNTADYHKIPSTFLCAGLRWIMWIYVQNRRAVSKQKHKVCLGFRSSRSIVNIIQFVYRIFCLVSLCCSYHVRHCLVTMSWFIMRLISASFCLAFFFC